MFLSYSNVDPVLIKRATGTLCYLFSTSLHSETPAYSLLKCLIGVLIPLYRIALTRAVKVGIIDSGVSIGTGAGILADSAADIALETFRTVSTLKDEVIRLLLPTAVNTPPAFGSNSSVLVNDAVLLQIVNLVEVNIFYAFI